MVSQKHLRIVDEKFMTHDEIKLTTTTQDLLYFFHVQTTHGHGMHCSTLELQGWIKEKEYGTTEWSSSEEDLFWSSYIYYSQTDIHGGTCVVTFRDVKRANKSESDFVGVMKPFIILFITPENLFGSWPANADEGDEDGCDDMEMRSKA